MHLKMSGFLLLKPSIEEPEPYTRVILYLDNDLQLQFNDRRKFGAVWLVNDVVEIVGKLGLEPLDTAFSVGTLGKLLSKYKMPIKALLCDQNIIAGIGNMYADEILFAARIHPLRQSNSLSLEEVGRLHEAARMVLQAGIERNGASVDTYHRPDGELGTAHLFFKVAHRRKEVCCSCNAPIERIAVRGRGTYFCPHCQQSDNDCL